MKFAKYLESESIPEWRKAYIDYKGLKKKLKAIEKVKTRYDPLEGFDEITNFLLLSLIAHLHYSKRNQRKHAHHSPLTYQMMRIQLMLQNIELIQWILPETRI